MKTSSATASDHDALRFDTPEQELFLNLWRTYDRLRMLEDELFREFGLTPQQYNVLRLLRAIAPEAMPTLVIADRLVSRAPDVSRMLDKLERGELVTRLRPPENRRQVLVAISPRGKELLRTIAEPLRACHQRQLGHLSSEERSRLVELLKLARQPHENEESCWR